MVSHCKMLLSRRVHYTEHMSSQTLMAERCQLPLTLQVNYLKMKFWKIRPQALARLCMQHLIPKFENASTAVLPTIIHLDVLLLEMQIVTVVERKASLQRFACQNKRHHLPPLHLLPIV